MLVQTSQKLSMAKNSHLLLIAGAKPRMGGIVHSSLCQRAPPSLKYPSCLFLLLFYSDLKQVPRILWNYFSEPLQNRRWDRLYLRVLILWDNPSIQTSEKSSHGSRAC